MIQNLTFGIEKEDKLEVAFGHFDYSKDPFVVVRIGLDVSLYAYDKKKMLELAEKLKQAAQEWRE